VYTWQMTQVKQNARMTKCAGSDYWYRMLTSGRRRVNLHQQQIELTPRDLLFYDPSLLQVSLEIADQV
jgi:hypothetical protein